MGSLDDDDHRLGLEDDFGAHGQSADIEVIPTRTLATSVRRQSQPIGDPLKFIKTSADFLAEEAKKQIELSEETKLKRAAELEGRPVVETVKEEDSEWQNNLDSWKTRRRSRNTLQLKNLGASMEEEMDANAKKQIDDKKPKTFSEMINESDESALDKSSLSPNPPGIQELHKNEEDTKRKGRKSKNPQKKPVLSNTEEEM